MRNDNPINHAHTSHLLTAVQCSAVQCSAVQCSAVQCHAMPCHAMLHPTCQLPPTVLCDALEGLVTVARHSLAANILRTTTAGLVRLQMLLRLLLLPSLAGAAACSRERKLAVCHALKASGITTHDIPRCTASPPWSGHLQLLRHV